MTWYIDIHIYIWYVCIYIYIHLLDMVCVHLGIVLEHNVVNHLGRHPIVLVWFPPLVYNVHLPFLLCLSLAWPTRFRDQNGSQNLGSPFDFIHFTSQQAPKTKNFQTVAAAPDWGCEVRTLPSTPTECQGSQLELASGGVRWKFQLLGVCGGWRLPHQYDPIERIQMMGHTSTHSHWV